MYMPQRYAQGDTAVAHELIRSNVFATIITQVSERLDATHVPVVLDDDRGPLGSLRFHLARANPTSEALMEEREILMVFVGPHTYISPDWYENENLVPTWNYAVVHAYGVPRKLDDAELRKQLDDLSASQETRLPKPPWTRDKMPAELVDKMCNVIVGFDLAVTELQAKWKMSQNRTAGDCSGVIAALEEIGGESNLAVAATMRSLS